MTFRIMISDKMSPEGLAHFTGHEGFEMVYDPEITMEQLTERIGEFDALVIRSRTKVKAPMLANPGKLKVIGRAGAGVDNVDVTAATEKGIIVMNTPGGNTISTAEHAISLMFALARRIPQAHRTMADGQWAKSKITGVEMFEKTLGIVGLGKIGRVVCERMQAFGMDVLVYDPFLTEETAKKLGVTPADVDTICRKADVISLHCPLNDETRGLIDAGRLAMMKPTTMIINAARGGIIDEDALLAALNEKRLAGAALDVYATEPLPEDHPFRKLDNVVLTPHLAASTSEAQDKVAKAIAEQIRDALSGEVVRNAVNAPSVDAKTYAVMRPLLALAERMGKFVSQFAKPAVQRIDVTYSGTMAEHPTEPLTTALVTGFLACSVSEVVNNVNAMHMAGQLGIKISETRTSDAGDVYAGLITVETRSDCGEARQISATLNQQGEPRLVVIDGKQVDAEPGGEMLVLENRDVPGIIGSVATTLGNHQINIASMNWGRVAPGGDALMLINVDQPIEPSVLEQIEKLPNVLMARRIVI